MAKAPVAAKSAPAPKAAPVTKAAPPPSGKGAAVTKNAVAKNVPKPSPAPAPTTQAKKATGAPNGPKSGVLATQAAKAAEKKLTPSQKADQARNATRAKNAELKKKTPTAWQKPKVVAPVVPAKPKPKTPAKKPAKPPVIESDPPFVPPEPDSVGGGDSSSTPTTPPVKSAPIDTVVFIDEAVSSELITDLLFEDIGGQELLTIARNDTVNGQSVSYQPIKNLNILQNAYNPSNLLRLQETSDKYFANFIIDLRDKIPKVGNGENGLNYYLDLANGDGVIEFINLKADEQVEVQIASAGIIEDVGI